MLGSTECNSGHGVVDLFGSSDYSNIAPEVLELLAPNGSPGEYAFSVATIGLHIIVGAPTTTVGSNSGLGAAVVQNSELTGADLKVIINEDDRLGSQIKYHFQVKNPGPNTAENVIVSDPMQAEADAERNDFWFFLNPPIEFALVLLSAKVDPKIRVDVGIFASDSSGADWLFVRVWL